MAEGSTKDGAEKRLVIIDGYSLLYRAFFATRYLSTADGRPTNALHGFTAMLFAILENLSPTAIVVALDGGRTFRHDLDEGYKGTRKETADELKVQLVEARNLIAALGIPSIEVPNYEADDICGTISKKGEENGYLTTVVTGDLDSLQLVDQCVQVMTPRVGMSDTTVYDRDAVVSRYGFGPEYVPDYKAIKGDTSDNIKGVPGIGDKGAAELIDGFGTIEQMWARWDEIPPKYQKKMDGLKAQMEHSKLLATIVRDVPLEYDFRAFKVTREQVDEARLFMENFELKSHARNIERALRPYLGFASEEEEAAAPAFHVEEAYNFKESEVKSAAMLAARVKDHPWGLYLQPSVKNDLFDEGPRTAFVAVDGEVLRTTEEAALQALAQYGARAAVHDSKAVYRRAQETAGLEVTIGFDATLAGYVLQSGRTSYGLRDLIGGYTDLAAPTRPEELAHGLLMLRDPMCERLTKEGQLSVFENIEMPVAPILAGMEEAGIAVEAEQLREFSKELEVTIERTEGMIFEMAGEKFTLGSPKQLGAILFDKMGLPSSSKTATGAYATGSEVLAPLAGDHPIAGEVLNWRELTRLKTTYADALVRLIAPDGRIHTTYNQTIAATGRVSSNDPNLQNIPMRTELGRSIRRAFVAKPGYELLSLDYSQIELRVLAHMSDEPALTEAFETGEDVHTATARTLFELGEDAKPDKEQRRLAKMLNYAVLYGVSGYGLAAQLGVGFSVAQSTDLIRLYNERFPTVKAFTKGIVAEARSKGFTTTLSGRRRYFPDIHAARVQDRQYAERQAMNAPIQGTAADMLKLAMITVARLVEGTPSQLLLNVHDELVLEVPEGDRSLVEPVRQAMETALPLSVPIEVDAKVGRDWNEMTPVAR